MVALGTARGPDAIALTGFLDFDTLEAWAAWLRATPAWVGGFDLPFGLPRELVQQFGWPLEWLPLMNHYASLGRDEIRRSFAAFCAARPVGGKFAHRRTDGPAGSSPSMKWVNPPVAFMLHAGVPRLIAAGATLPGLHRAGPDEGGTRIALEAYPGLLARELIGRRSYKSDSGAAQTPERQQARGELLAALERGSPRLRLRLECEPQARRLLQDDAKGDRIDAVVCLLQAGWAALRHDSRPGPGWGLPDDIDPLEGWIVTA